MNTPTIPQNFLMRKMRIKRRGLTLCLGSCIGDNAVSSARLAYELARSEKHGHVLFVNTFQGQWKLDESLKMAVGDGFSSNCQDVFGIHDSTIGELALEATTLSQRLDERYRRIDTVVINSWEFAAKDSRSRERLLFMLQDWVTRRAVTVIIFAEELTRNAVAGKIMRGGYGRVLGVVDSVCGIPATLVEELRVQNDELPIEEAAIDRLARVEALQVQEATVAEIAEDEVLSGILREHGIDQPKRLPMPKDLNAEPVCVHSEVVEFETVTGDGLAVDSSVFFSRER